MATKVQVQGLSTTIYGLVPKTKYYFQVQAFNGSTPGPLSAVQSVETLDSQQSNVVLINNKIFVENSKIAIANGGTLPITFSLGNQANVTGLATFGETANSVNIVFTTPTNGTNTYQYQVKRQSDFTWSTSSPFSFPATPGTAIGFSLGNLNSNTAYQFRVAANHSQYTLPVLGITLGSVNNESPDGSFQDGPIIS